MLKMIYMLFAVMLAGYCFQPALAADHKIVVIADPHVMPASLLTNPNNPDWTTCLNEDRKLLDYSQTLFDQAMTDITTIKPELVLIVGDLTKDGEEASHNYLKGKLDDLKDAGIQTLVIPGNHDLGTTDAKIFGKTTTPAATIDKDGFATLYEDYGYGATSERESVSSLTYACEPIEGIMVIGIDTGIEGKLSDKTLTWVCDKAQAAHAEGKQVIAMMHYPLIPHITGGETFVSSVSVDNYANVRNSLADAGISVVFSGHFHTSDIAKDWNGDKSKTIYDVTTSSLCSYPCDYRIVTLNNTLTSMSIATKSITSAGAPIGGGDSFTTSIAKQRLESCMTSSLTPIIKAKLMERLNSDYLATAGANTIVPKLVDAYIYHAEGNENDNSDAQTLLMALNSLLSTYPAYQAMANSMLQDKSNYGDADREDQTNDRTLTIPIKENGEEDIATRRPGDANNDENVDVADIVEMVNAKEGKPTSENFSLMNADIVNADNAVSQDDIDAGVMIIMGTVDEDDKVEDTNNIKAN